MEERVDRKDTGFIALFSVLIIFLLVNFKINPEKSSPHPYIKGVYITSWTAGNSLKMDHFMHLIKATELNAVIIDIKEVDGRITFDTESPLINILGSEMIIIPNLKELINKFRQEHIYVIARIVVLKDMFLPKIKPNLVLKDKSGQFWRDRSGKTWLDPASKEVWDYHVELAREAIKIGFDEINFDYIRFPSDGNISQIVYPVWDGKEAKAEVIRRFFEYLSGHLSSSGAFLSVDLFGLTMVKNDDLNIGQLLESAIPYFDFICPMVYPSHYPSGFNGYKNPALYPYEIIKMNLAIGKKRMANSKAMPTGRQAKLRPWLQDFDLGAIYDKRMIELQKQAVYDTDSFGWLLWNPASRYTEEALEKD